MLTAEQRLQTACEATLLLNEALRELGIPRRIFALTENIPDGPVDIRWLSGVRHVVLQSIVLSVYRVWEVRNYFLLDWLLTDAELRSLNFPPIEEFIGVDRWSDFLLVRHNYAGHATAATSTKRGPARLVPAKVLGRAMRQCGLAKLESFLDRVIGELAPGVEATMGELRRQYPEVDAFVMETHPTELSEELHRVGRKHGPTQ
jgi:hypothetical protein